MSNSKLIVLTERNNLEYLNEIGVYPSEFYTDFEIFKERLPYFDNVIVVILFSGGCGLSQKKVLELAETIDKRVLSADNSIKEFYILSDFRISGCKKYYLYDYAPVSFVQCSGNKKSKEVVDIWGKLIYDNPVNSPRSFLETVSYTNALKSVVSSQIGTDGRASKLIVPAWRLKAKADEDKQEAV